MQLLSEDARGSRQPRVPRGARLRPCRASAGDGDRVNCLGGLELGTTPSCPSEVTSLGDGAVKCLLYDSEAG